MDFIQNKSVNILLSLRIIINHNNFEKIFLILIPISKHINIVFKSLSFQKVKNIWLKLMLENHFKIINFLIHYTNLLEVYKLIKKMFNKKSHIMSILKINFQKWLIILQVQFIKIKVFRILILKMKGRNSSNFKIYSLS